MDDNDLVTKQTPKTYVGPDGTELSTIDCVMISRSVEGRIMAIHLLDNIHSSTSDDYPVLCVTNLEYQSLMAEGVSTIEPRTTVQGVLDNDISKLNKILVNASAAAGPCVVR